MTLSQDFSSRFLNIKYNILFHCHERKVDPQKRSHREGTGVSPLVEQSVVEEPLGVHEHGDGVVRWLEGNFVADSVDVSAVVDDTVLGGDPSAGGVLGSGGAIWDCVDVVVGCVFSEVFVSAVVVGDGVLLPAEVAEVVGEVEFAVDHAGGVGVGADGVSGLRAHGVGGEEVLDGDGGGDVVEGLGDKGGECAEFACGGVVGGREPVHLVHGVAPEAGAGRHVAEVEALGVCVLDAEGFTAGHVADDGDVLVVVGAHVEAVVGQDLVRASEPVRDDTRATGS